MVNPYFPQLPPTIVFQSGAARELGFTPIVRVTVIIEPPQMSATATASAPTLRAIVKPPAISAVNASASTPTVRIQARPPAATVAGAAFASTQRAILSVPVAGATSAGIAPNPQEQVPPPVASVAAAASAPSLRAIIRPPVAGATAQAFGTALLVTVDVMSALAGALTPTVALRVYPPALGTATATIFTPGVQLIVRVPVTSASAEMFLPEFPLVLTITVPAMTAAAAMSAPALRIVVRAPVTGATAAALDPAYAGSYVRIIFPLAAIPTLTAWSTAAPRGVCVAPGQALSAEPSITPGIAEVAELQLAK